MTLEQMILIVLVGFGVWIFWRQLAIRELALRHANAACSKADVQLLDQSIGLSKLRLSKLTGGGVGLLREYRFEFTSTGEQRYVGRIFMVGHTLQRVEMDAFREPI